jgi:TrmH family RNA methyltransferase
MGSFFKVPVIRITGNNEIHTFIDKMKADYPTFKTIGSTAHKQTNVYDVDMTSPVMFMIGNETDGLCKEFKEHCDVLMTIPMSENSAATSFNVGCAATVMFYEAVRQRA